MITPKFLLYSFPPWSEMTLRVPEFLLVRSLSGWALSWEDSLLSRHYCAIAVYVIMPGLITQ